VLILAAISVDDVLKRMNRLSAEKPASDEFRDRNMYTVLLGVRQCTVCH
jgi:hypothetical protein